jgi:Tol biopolymer transport system component
MVASLDGGEPRELARRVGNDWFNGVPAWSPDGRVIACVAATDTGGTQFTLVEVPAEGGAQRPITSYKWHGAAIRPFWLKDGGGLIVNAKELPTSPTQIWQVSYPEGAVGRVTNDLTQYGTSSFGLTADSSTIVTIATEQSSQVWLAAPNEEEGRARRLTDGKYDGQAGLDLTPDGRVVYTARKGDSVDIWITNADGTGQKQLTSNDDSESAVRVSPDGRRVVFAAQRAGAVQHVWRVDTDGSNLKQLTDGDAIDFYPFWSPDGQWVFFASWRTGSPRLWKVPADGGPPAQVSDLPFMYGVRFPAGSGLVFGRYYDEQVSPPRPRWALLSPESGQLVKVFDYPPKAVANDILDERTLVYAETNNGDVDNLWSRPLEGGAPRQLTRFTSGLIFAFNQTRDARQFAVARGTNSADIILIQNFR